MRIGWGWRIALLYGTFATLMIMLVVASSRQKFDLVAKDYYQQELQYQELIDAGKNQSGLSKAVLIHANETTVTIDFPDEFKDLLRTGNIHFYSPVNEKWDRKFPLNTTDNSISIPRNTLENTQYTIKIRCTVAGKEYYQESQIQLPS